MKTFPQIFIGHTLVGGFDQLLQIHQEQGLKVGLSEIAANNGETQ
jgi:glutaredoxin-related protein